MKWMQTRKNILFVEKNHFVKFTKYFIDKIFLKCFFFYGQYFFKQI